MAHDSAGQPRDDTALLLDAASGGDSHRFTPSFLLSKWEDVVDAWQTRLLGSLSRFTLPAHEPEIIYWLPAVTCLQSFWMTFR